jgi:hypothetical protein
MTGIIANLSSHGVAISYDSQTHTTNCFVIGLCEHQIARCKRELRALQDFAGDAMLFASIWLDVFTETRARRAEGRRIAMHKISIESGMHWSVDATQLDSMALNFDALTHKLTVLWSELAWDDFALKTLTRFRTKIVRARETSHGEDHVLSGVNRVGDVLDQRLRHANDLLQGLQESTKFTTQLAKVQLKTVRY